MQTVHIGPIPITSPAALAPMAGVTDAAFRQVCRRHGAAYTVSEMISAKAMEFDDPKTARLADLSHDEGPVFLQLFGSDPACMAAAAKKLLAFSPAGFDINMGCPVPKVTGGGAGSALMRDPCRCGEIVAAVKAAGLPVTVKLRAGWDAAHINAPEVAKICESAGADAVCVHGRTREQMYQGQADWGVIRRVKEAVGIPVIGNGDVTGALQAARLLTETGCDLVMAGRGALGNPWVFEEINAYLQEDCRLLPPPSLAQRLLAMRRHIGLMCQYKGEPHAMREARKHVGWYLKGIRGAAQLRRQAGGLETLDGLDQLITSAWQLAGAGSPGGHIA